MKYTLLEETNFPADVKKLDYGQLAQLCAEIREFLIQNVSQTGGHLSSNLGVIELTVALHYVFNSPQDKIIFDVGHQCYTHKLLTGRRKGFATLRQQGGLSGFPNPKESEHDAFLAGHGSTALSAAVGFARAKKLKNEPGVVIAIIGDGAFTGGMVYEALNNIADLDNLIVILNDNKMSISKNEGAMAKYFTKLRTSPGYYKAKSDVKSVLDNTPIIGDGMIRGITAVKNVLRRTIYHSTFFEEMGLQYVGPANGHDVAGLCNLFSWIKDSDIPLFVHLETVKGKGFRPAEKNPGAFHGVGTFNHQHITDPDVAPQDSFSTNFGKTLVEVAGEDNCICAITAAMKYGTGLQYFKKAYPARFFDVGIAEEHAVTFAAGLASEGLVPVVSIYSTFLQRSYDQLIHDVMLQNLNVLFAIDRAGLVPADGETHQGIYDAAYLSQQSGMPVVSPANYAEQAYWLQKLLEDYTGPRALRYPRGEEPGELKDKVCTGAKIDQLVKQPGAKVVLVSYGGGTVDAMAAAQQLSECGILADMFQMVWINPIDEAFIKTLLNYELVLFAEEGIRQGGIGEHVALRLLQAGYKGVYKHIAVPETGVDHATVPQLRTQYGLDAHSLAETVQELYNER